MCFAIAETTTAGKASLMVSEPICATWRLSKKILTAGAAMEVMKGLATSFAGILAIACTISFISAPAVHAGMIMYQAGNLDEYGMVPTGSCQLSMGTKGLCAAAATANSFAFLKNHYPTIYGGTNIIPHIEGNTAQQDLVAARESLAFGWTAGNGRQDGIYNGSARTASEDWYQAKVNWFTDYAPNTTRLLGMTSENIDATNPLNRGLIGGTFPTWDFLLMEIQAGEDVEIGIVDRLGTPLHAVTLVKLVIDDTNDNGHWDPGETRTAMYLDSNHLGMLSSGVLTEGEGGRLLLPFGEKDAFIGTALSESPIPEPGTWLLLLSGTVGLWLLRKRIV